LLRRDIHTQFHDLYHYGNNTEAQFAAFVRQHYGKDWFAIKAAIISAYAVKKAIIAVYPTGTVEK